MKKITGSPLLEVFQSKLLFKSQPRAPVLITDEMHESLLYLLGSTISCYCRGKQAQITQCHSALQQLRTDHPQNSYGTVHLPQYPHFECYKVL